MKKAIKILIFLLIVALLITGAVKLVKKKKAQEAAIPIAKEYAILAKTITPKREHITLTTPYLALVKSDQEVNLAAKFPARILEIANEAEVVKKDQIIIKLDDTNLKTKLKELIATKDATQEEIAATKVALANLAAAHKRTMKLFAVKGASKEQIEQEESKIAATKAKLASQKAKLNALKAKIENIKNELNYALIKAPFDGTIGKKFANSGDLAMPGKPLLKLTNSAASYFLVRIPTNFKAYGLIYKNKRFALHDTRATFNSLKELRANIKDPSLVPGERIQVSIITFDGFGTFLPQDAILNRDGKSYVLIAKGNEAHPMQVHTISSSDKGVVIQEDLSGKEIVVAKPDILLRLLSGIKLKAIKD